MELLHPHHSLQRLPHQLIEQNLAHEIEKEVIEIEGKDRVDEMMNEVRVEEMMNEVRVEGTMIERDPREDMMTGIEMIETEIQIDIDLQEDMMMRDRHDILLREEMKKVVREEVIEGNWKREKKDQRRKNEGESIKKVEIIV